MTIRYQADPQKGKAYVDDLSADEIRQYRGTLTEPGKESPYRNRSVEENLDLFERMRAGEFPTAPACCAQRSICPQAT
jgi:glutamyl/glutaminyl-tRNA synthetase